MEFNSTILFFKPAFLKIFFNFSFVNCSVIKPSFVKILLFLVFTILNPALFKFSALSCRAFSEKIPTAKSWKDGEAAPLTILSFSLAAL